MGSDAAMDVAEGTPLIASPAKVQRTWRNSWAALFGDGSPQDLASCCLAYHAPCVAFGWNHSRGLQMSFWRELLRFVLFTLGTFVFIKVACCAVVMLSCPPPALDAVKPSALMDGRAAAAASTTSAAQPRPDDWMMYKQNGAFPHGQDPHHPDPMMMMMRDPECAERAVPGMVLVLLMGCAMAGYFVFLAARRRQALRERFGIEGSFAKDVWLWACCSLCALTQETRTLLHEQVHEGVWYGAVPASAPPAKQCMAV